MGPWRIAESLGTGNFGHSFLVELDGELFTLKMAVRPAAELSPETLELEEALEKWQVDARMCHEGAILLANIRHPGLPLLRAVGRWPHFRRGYFFIVTDHVPGEPFHRWRKHTRPGAAQLVDLFSKPRTRFSADKAGDLYQLGVLMYEALTECWPFDPRFPTEELLAAILTVLPRAPHRLNPAVPESLSRITMRLLEKRPEDRYESAEVLLQALWDANKERSSRSWRTPLALPPGDPPPMSQDEKEERRLALQEAEHRALEARQQQQQELSLEQEMEELSATIQQLGARAHTADTLEAKVRAIEEKAARRRMLGRRIALAAGPLLLGLALVSVWREWRSSSSLPEVRQGAPELEQQTGASSLGEAAATEFPSAPEPLPTHEGVTAEIPPGPRPGQRTPLCKRPAAVE